MKSFVKPACAVLSLLCVLPLAACSSETVSDNLNSAPERTAVASEITNSDSKYFDYAQNEVYISDEKTVDFNKKIIKNAALHLESDNVSEAYKKLLDFVKSIDGYEFSMDFNKSGDYISISAKLKVTPDKLDLVLDYAAECGDISYINTSSSDITELYYDIQIRLENKRKNLEKYYEYLSAAVNVEEMVKLQNEIDKITAEIEGYEGMIRLWNSQVSESEITLNIYQKNDPNKIVEKIEFSSMSAGEMGIYMLNGLKSVCNVIFGAVQWVLIIIVTLSPIIIILGIVVFIIIRISKKNAKKTNNEKEESD